MIEELDDDTFLERLELALDYPEDLVGVLHEKEIISTKEVIYNLLREVLLSNKEVIASEFDLLSEVEE